MKDFSDCYLVVYDLNDNYICELETIDEATKLFNKEKKEIYRKLRNNDCIVFNGHKVRLYLMEKFDIEEDYCRCMN